MNHLRRWVARLLLWPVVWAWRRAAGPGAPLWHVQVIARRDRKGRVYYQLLDGIGERADGIAFSNLFTGIADLGLSIDGLDERVRLQCSRLSVRMRELQLLAMASAAVAAEQEQNTGGQAA